MKQSIIYFLLALWRLICEALLVLGVYNRPSWFTQYFWWIAKILPLGFNLHIVGIAALCWAVWKTRNKACFENKLISSPVSLICYMCFFTLLGRTPGGERQADSPRRSRASPTQSYIGSWCNKGNNHPDQTDSRPRQRRSWCLGRLTIQANLMTKMRVDSCWNWKVWVSFVSYWCNFWGCKFFDPGTCSCGLNVSLGVSVGLALCLFGFNCQWLW
jgi:hypothetical protein